MKKYLFGHLTAGFLTVVILLILSAVPSYGWTRSGWGDGGGWRGGSWHGGFHHPTVVVSNRVVVNNSVVVVQRPCCFRPHVFFGVGVAVPFWYPAYVYPGPVYAPPVVAQPAPQPQQYWYYCQSPQGYYPYVKECPSSWLQVVPQPTPPSQ